MKELQIPAATMATRGRSREGGYAMAVLLVGIAIMGIMLGVAMPVWHQATQREKEAELIFRGNQYARAVGLYLRKNGNAYPPSLDVLVQQKYLRKKYKDPMTEDGVFQLVPAGGLQGQVGAAGAATGLQLGQTSSFGQPFGPGRGGSTQSRSGTQTVVTAIAGVVSKSTDKSIALYNGRDHYNEWVFTFQSTRGVVVPGAGRGRGQGGPGRGQGPGGPGRGQGPGRGVGPGRGGFGPGGGFDPTQFPPELPGGRGGRGQ